MRPDLTIAIPTYNRLKTLKQSLELAVKYSVGKSVEIMVSDNASDDGTESFMLEYCKRNPVISYFRNLTNLGFDGNFQNCFAKATGKYIILLSDDDILLEGSIESILEAIARDPVFIFLNTSSINSEDPLVISQPLFQGAGFEVFNEKNQFLEKIGIYSTFCSALVFKMDFIRKINSIEKYRGNIHVHQYVLETLKYDGKYIINYTNCIAARKNTTVSYDVYKVWVFQYADVLFNVGRECGFLEENLNNIVYNDLKNTILRFVLNLRKTCVNEKSWNKSYVWKYVNQYRDLIPLYQYAVFCPKFLLPLVSKFIFFLRKVEKIIRLVC